MRLTLPIGATLLVLVPLALPAAEPKVLPGTERLEIERPLWEEMVDGIDRFCLREIASSVERRARRWKPDHTDWTKYTNSVAPNRERLATYLGVVDDRVVPVARWRLPELVEGKIVGEPFRLPVLEGVTVEGLILRPPVDPWTTAIVLPDADWTPEAFVGLTDDAVPEDSQLPLSLARMGCVVVVPTLISRDHEFSGHPDVGFTNQPHREWVYRPAFQMGRHVAGYEVQKVLAIVDAIEREKCKQCDPPIVVSGVGEGARIALFAAALDSRIDAAHVCGDFGPREDVWREPIDRNVWRLLDEFGDAEIGRLIAPRPLIVRECPVPGWTGPQPVNGRRNGAAPGRIVGRTPDEVAREVKRLVPVYERLLVRERLIHDTGARANLAAAMPDVLTELTGKVVEPVDWATRVNGELVPPKVRQQRQVDELVAHAQGLMERSDRVRYATWNNADRGRSKRFTPAEWEERARPLREWVYDELIGRLPEPTMPPKPRTRLVIDEPTHTGYEVALDVYPDVIAGGILLIPKGMSAGERRPVVVCQHGLEGTPMDTITTDESSRAWRPYKGFSTQLVRRGFVVYAPQNPYKGGDRFRTLQRKSNPLGRSLFSYITRQHERTLVWLASLPFVDGDRLGFYGLSYGGKTAMRVPALLPPREGRPGYCLSICSADFNEWVRKNVTNRARYSYVFTGEYEIFEWNMGHVANYAELASLISPRPFMVERGHDDGVAPDEWVAWEFAKVRRHYVKLGIGDRTEIEWFDGPHTINGRGTFDFLHRHLHWPAPVQ